MEYWNLIKNLKDNCLLCKKNQHNFQRNRPLKLYKLSYLLNIYIDTVYGVTLPKKSIFSYYGIFSYAFLDIAVFPTCILRTGAGGFLKGF